MHQAWSTIKSGASGMHPTKNGAVGSATICKMPNYKRLDAPGASIFFTVVTHLRRPILTTPAALDGLRAAFRTEMQHHPFAIDAIVILPDHLHTIWTLPPGDSRFSVRWTKIKGDFTEAFLAGGGVEGPRSASRMKRGERGVWQRRFWDHVVRNEHEYAEFTDYIHWNPVKHEHAGCPHEWPHSSFHKWVRQGRYRADWMCGCKRAPPKPPTFDGIQEFLDDIE